MTMLHECKRCRITRVGLAFSVFVWTSLVPIAVSLASNTPDQVHLSIGRDPSVVVVTWVTENETAESVVRYGCRIMDRRQKGIQESFLDGGSEQRRFIIHRVAITNLTAGAIYDYQCGCDNNWSRVFQFRALPNHTNWSPRLAIFGDMGVINGRALPELERETVHLQSFDAVMHVGDFAYNMDTDNARYGDQFMRNIEPIASRVPYMTAVGNHELAYNFSNYKARFTMPGGDGQGQFYSFNLGPAHIIAFSSELYYYLYYGWTQLYNQYEWLKNDLYEANKPENRRIRPWVIAMAHRPMYCSNSNDAMHCNNVDNTVRTGFPYNANGSTKYILGLEDLFYNEGVDIIIAAHEHSYERFWPVYNLTVCNASTNQPYVEPPAPIHIVTGSAGSNEGLDPFLPGGHPWSAFRADDYGFTRMHVINSTMITVDQVSVDQGINGTTIDSFTIIKSRHGRGLYKCHNKTQPEVLPMMALKSKGDLN